MLSSSIPKPICLARDALLSRQQRYDGLRWLPHCAWSTNLLDVSPQRCWLQQSEISTWHHCCEKLHQKTTAANPILVVVVVVEEAGTEGGLHHPDHTSHCHLSVIEYHRKDIDNGPEVRRFFKTCPTTSPLEIFGWYKVPLQTPSSIAFYWLRIKSLLMNRFFVFRGAGLAARTPLVLRLHSSHSTPFHDALKRSHILPKKKIYPNAGRSADTLWCINPGNERCCFSDMCFVIESALSYHIYCHVELLNQNPFYTPKFNVEARHQEGRMAMVAEAVAGAAPPRQAEVEEEAAAACHIQTPSSAAQLYPVPTNLCRVALGFWLIFPSLLLCSSVRLNHLDPNTASIPDLSSNPHLIIGGGGGGPHPHHHPHHDPRHHQHPPNPSQATLCQCRSPPSNTPGPDPIWQWKIKNKMSLCLFHGQLPLIKWFQWYEYSNRLVHVCIDI